MPTAIMELLVFYPETTEPKRRHFDGPVLLGVQQALGENAEVIPGFTTIPCDGVIQRCVASLVRADATVLCVTLEWVCIRMNSARNCRLLPRDSLNRKFL